jgi:hypothetical protein
MIDRPSVNISPVFFTLTRVALRSATWSSSPAFKSREQEEDHSNLGNQATAEALDNLDTSLGVSPFRKCKDRLQSADL